MYLKVTTEQSKKTKYNSCGKRGRRKWNCINVPLIPEMAEKHKKKKKNEIKNKGNELKTVRSKLHINPKKVCFR